MTTVSRKSVSFSRFERQRLVRIDDDARQARGIEHPFFEVEFPRAVLLRHQPALEAVREPRDDRGEILQLLVEEGAQPLEFFRIAQLLGRHDLVVAAVVGAVLRPARLVAALRGRAARIRGLLGIGIIGLVGGFAARRLRGIHRRIVHLLGGRLRLLALLAVVGALGIALALLVLLVLVVGLVVARLVVVLLVGARLLAHVERGEQLVDGLREGLLVLHRRAELVEIAPDAFLDPRAPQVDDALAALRRTHPGEALAHHHRQRLLERRILAPRHLGQPGAHETVVQHGSEVAGDAFHAARADRLDAGLLDGIETGAASRRLRHQAAVDVAVVAGETQRHRVGVAAHDRRVARIELARRLGQARLDAFGRGDEARPLGRVGHLEVGRPGERAHAAGHCALERLLRRVGLARWLVV